MTFRRRTFPEVLDALLVAVTGGVAAEAYPFPPDGSTSTPPRQSLLRAASALVSVYGSRGGEPHEFRRDVDYKLDGSQAVAWQPKAELPDPGTLISINYYPQGVQPLVTDLQVGSVLRTVLETTAREIAGLSAQLEQVYRSAFVDTASGSALDNVVSLVGIRRVTGGRAAGEVEFSRSPATPGSITIPSGTRVITADGSVTYETTAAATLADGQPSIRVPARDLDTNQPLRAGALTVMPSPIAGIVSVTNPDPTAMASRDESDDELRTRAKSFLHGSERATPGALVAALAAEGVRGDVTELAGLDASGHVTGSPGVVEITPHADAMTPDLQQRLLTAIEDVRPAGVVVRLQGASAPARLDLDLRLTTAPGLLDQDLRAAQRGVRDGIGTYLQRLPTSSDASLSQLAGSVMSVNGVQDLRVVAATLSNGSAPANVLDPAGGVIHLAGVAVALGDVRITDPALPTSLDVTVTVPAAREQPDQGAMRSVMGDAVSYLNALNATDLGANPSDADVAKRTLTFGRLLLPLPLPTRDGVTLAEFDQSTAPPALPDPSAVAPYVVRFVLTQESGLSAVLAGPDDAPYRLAPGERLTLRGVVVGG